MREQQAAQRAKNEACKHEERRAWVEEHRDQLEDFPHPAPHFAKQGKTLADYVSYCGPTRRVVATAKRALAATP